MVPWDDSLGDVVTAIADDEAPVESVDGSDVEPCGYANNGIERVRDPHWALVRKYCFSQRNASKYDKDGYVPIYWRNVQSRKWGVDVRRSGDKIYSNLTAVMDDGTVRPVHRLMTPFFVVQESYIGPEGTMGDEVYEQRMAEYMKGVARTDPSKHKLKLVGSTRVAFNPPARPGVAAGAEDAAGCHDDNEIKEDHDRRQWCLSRTRNAELMMFRAWLAEVTRAYIQGRIRLTATGDADGIVDSLQVFIDAQLSARDLQPSELVVDGTFESVTNGIVKKNLVKEPFFGMKKAVSTSGAPTRVGLDISTALAYTVADDQSEVPARVARNSFLAEKWRSGYEYKRIVVCRRPGTKESVDPGDIVAAVIAPDYYTDKNTLKFRLRGPMGTVFHSGASMPSFEASTGVADDVGAFDEWDADMFPEPMPLLE